jgi:hypothetical protein
VPPEGGKDHEKHPLLAPVTNIGANGLAFWHRSLYVAVADTGRIVRVPLLGNGRAGTPVVIAHAKMLRTADGIAFDVRADGLNYPTMPAFGTTCQTRTTLFITNGAFHGGTPNLVTLDAGVPGLPLP